MAYKIKAKNLTDQLSSHERKLKHKMNSQVLGLVYTL